MEALSHLILAVRGCVRRTITKARYLAREAIGRAAMSRSLHKPMKWATGALGSWQGNSVTCWILPRRAGSTQLFTEEHKSERVIVIGASSREWRPNAVGDGKCSAEGVPAVKGSIWILNHYAAGPGSTSGTRHYDLGRELVRLGWEVTVFAASFDHQKRQEAHLMPGQWIKEEAFQGVRFVWLRTLPYQGNNWRRVLNMFQYTFQVLRVAWKRSGPTVVIGSSVHPFAAWAGWVLARHHRSRFFFEVRDLWPETLIELGQMSPNNPGVYLLRRLEKFLYQEAERIIVLLPNAHIYIEGLGVPPDKIVYLPNGVDLRRFEDSNEKLPNNVMAVLERLGDSFIAVYAGAHGMTDQLDVLLDAAQLLRLRDDKKIHFLFVGDGPERLRLESRAIASGLSNVTFLGPLDKAYIPALLKRCNAGLVSATFSPLYRYGMSFNKVFDYMAARLPIAMIGPDYVNPISESGCGVILGGPEQLAEILVQWSDRPGLSRALGKKGRLFVETWHSIPRLASLLSQYCEQES